MTRSLRPLALGLLLVAASCGPAVRRGPDPDAATVIFINDTGEQANVFAVVPGSQPVKLGTIYALRTETFKVPGTVTGRPNGVHIVADMLARRGSRATDPISLPPGSSVQVRLDATFQLTVLPVSRRR
jgi:hypothetical protein